MRIKNLIPAILVVVVVAAACGSSQSETVTTPDADTGDGAAETQPTDASPSDGAASDEPSDTGGSDDATGASERGKDSASTGFDETDNGGDDDDAEDPEASSSDAGATGSSGQSSSSSSDDAAAASSDQADVSDSDIVDALPDSADDAVSISRDQLPDDAADITDPGPSNSGEPAPALARRKLAHITDVVMQVLESWPAQVIVEVSGELPSPCHDLWWEVDVDANTYTVQVWSVESELEIACAAVIEPFVENIPLGGGFVSEDYTIVVNGTSHPLNF